MRKRPPRVARRLKPGGLYRWVRRFRLPVAMVLGLCAAGSALLAVEGSQVQTTTAVRVTEPVAAGQVLTSSQLEETEMDASAVPEGHSADVEDYLGATAAAALPTGAVVHPSQLVGPGLLEGQDPGVSALVVRPADTAIIDLLAPGMRVDVLASSDAPEQESLTQRVAHSVPVLWIPQSSSENWISGGEGAADVVILAVDATAAEEIAQAAHRGRLHLSVVGSAQSEEEDEEDDDESELVEDDAAALRESVR